MTDAEIAKAVERAVTVVRQDQCADGYHDYRPWPDGLYRCSCGAARPECNRCGETRGVHRRTWCPECGPIFACNECDQYHQDEVAESELSS